MNDSKTKALLYAAALSLIAWANADAQGGPPMITDDPFTVGAKNWEINLLPSLERTRDGSLYEMPNLDLNYGVGYRIQLKFEVPWIVRKDAGQNTESGVGNVGIGMRYRFLDESRHGFAMSTYPAFDFGGRASSVRRGIAEAGRRFFLPVEIAKTINGTGVNGEVGYSFEQGGAGSWEYGLLFGRDASERVQLLGELHGSSPKDFSESETFLNVGSRVGLADHITLLVSAGRTLHGPGSPTTIAALGLQLGFMNTAERSQ
ncbi:MAG TPA: hypothetical protein VM166_13235 [Gemmatimonadaceae bacterium]|nr:hypothetical protein [Gemmatimonadaceae bacterium]